MTSQHSMLMTPHSEYVCHPLHCRWHRTHSINDITATLCMISHTVHMWHPTTIFMTSYPVCMTTQHCVLLIPHSAYVWSCFMTSQTLHSWHQISSIWHQIHSVGHHATLCMTSSPLYLTSRPLNLCHHSHPIDDITATIWMVSHPVYLWHHIPYI